MPEDFKVGTESAKSTLHVGENGKLVEIQPSGEGNSPEVEAKETLYPIQESINTKLADPRMEKLPPDVKERILTKAAQLKVKGRNLFTKLSSLAVSGLDRAVDSVAGDLVGGIEVAKDISANLREAGQEKYERTLDEIKVTIDALNVGLAKTNEAVTSLSQGVKSLAEKFDKYMQAPGANEMTKRQTRAESYQETKNTVSKARLTKREVEQGRNKSYADFEDGLVATTEEEKVIASAPEFIPNPNDIRTNERARVSANQDMVLDELTDPNKKLSPELKAQLLQQYDNFGDQIEVLQYEMPPVVTNLIKVFKNQGIDLAQFRKDKLRLSHELDQFLADPNQVENLNSRAITSTLINELGDRLMQPSKLVLKLMNALVKSTSFPNLTNDQQLYVNALTKYQEQALAGTGSIRQTLPGQPYNLFPRIGSSAKLDRGLVGDQNMRGW